MKNKKCQAWGWDLMVALFIFIFGIMAFFSFYLNYADDAGNTYENLRFDGNSMADQIFSEGSPADWNQASVISIGILTDHRINQTKLENFYYLAENNYSYTRALFNTDYDYFLFFADNLSLNGQSVRGIGKPGTDPSKLEASNLIKINRIAVLENQPASAYLYVWEN